MKIKVSKVISAILFGALVLRVHHEHLGAKKDSKKSRISTYLAVKKVVEQEVPSLNCEIAKGVTPIEIAIDGIAVIVNNENPRDELSKEDVQRIFTVEVEKWSKI